MSESDPKCCAKVYDRYTGSHACGRRGKVERDGKWYCGIHDPVRLKGEQDARDSAWKAKQQAQDEAWRRRRAEVRACESIPTEVLESGLIGRLWAEHLKRTGGQ